MNMRHRTALAICSINAIIGIALSAEPPLEPKKSANAVATTSKSARSLDDARREAAMLHTTLHSALQVVHHKYYREDEGLPLPATTLKDVFKEMEESHGIKLRWLAVEGQAMNTDHKPRDPFEMAAVEALKSGRSDFERTENGVYRRAGSITLGNHCLKCHVPNRKSTQDRKAGLIIAIPLN